MGSATQGVVIHHMLGAAPPPAPTPGPSSQPLAPPGQQWILVPTQYSGNEVHQQYVGQRYLECKNTGGAPKAQPPQTRPEPLPVLQLQQPVLPSLIPEPQATEPVLGKGRSMEDKRTSKLQVDGSNRLHVIDTLARIEETAKTSQAELQKGLAIIEKTQSWLGNIGVQSKRQADQSTVQFEAQQKALMELTKMVEAADANCESQMETLTRSMTELAEKTRMIAQARVPHAQQELTKNLGMKVVRCHDAVDKLTKLIENC